MITWWHNRLRRFLFFFISKHMKMIKETLFRVEGTFAESWFVRLIGCGWVVDGSLMCTLWPLTLAHFFDTFSFLILRMKTGPLGKGDHVVLWSLDRQSKQYGHQQFFFKVYLLVSINSPCIKCLTCSIVWSMYRWTKSNQFRIIGKLIKRQIFQKIFYRSLSLLQIIEQSNTTFSICPLCSQHRYVLFSIGENYIWPVLASFHSVLK